MRVLHVIGSLGPGGAEALLYRLVTRPSKFEHEVVSLLPEDWYSSRLRDHGVKVHHLDIRSAVSAVQAFSRLRRILSKADVVQTWMYRSNVYAGFAARTSGVPVIWGIHAGSLEPLRLGGRFWAYAGGALALWLPNHVINCSPTSAKLHRRMGYSLAATSVIPNGYDPDSFFPVDPDTRAADRAALGILDDLFLIGSVSRWNPMKDIPNLLAALGILKSKGTPFKCILVGDGLDESNPALVAQAKEFGCTDELMALGRRGDAPDLMRLFDVHVLGSASEAFPNTVAETMLSEVPNVVTDVGDSGLIVGSTGWVVPPSDPAALAGAIEQAFAERKKRSRAWKFRRKAARERILENFTFERMALEYEQIWEKAVRRDSNR